MINVMHALNKPMNQVEKGLDPELWHACAGGMAQIPPLNSKVYYFPQGHSEHANRTVDFSKFPKIPPLIPCKVSSIKYLADSETDEVYAKIRLIPLRGNEFSSLDNDENGFLGLDSIKNDEKDKPNSFAKTLTQSDANNGGGFSVPRYCAETIFPRLDYSAEPPVQTILVKDVHGEIWKFRHIYRGTPRRHLLTTGWSNFVNQKKLVAGDSIVFLRAENGDLCVGIRRAKVGISDVSSGWNTGFASYGGGFSGFLSENGIGNSKRGSGNSRSGGDECVVEAARLAAKGEAFEVIYYPRASTPEFVVRVSTVRAAMRVHWCSGLRFKMAFETEDSSRISWFMGTISSVQVDDPIHWPNSPWRLLQVSWDEPELLQNVKRVNPWLVELVSSIHLSPFSPPRKRARPTFLTNPLSPSSPLCCLLDNISSGIQGARQAHFGSSPPSDLHFKKLQPFDFTPLSYPHAPSCPSKIGDSKNNDEGTKPVFLLFGQPILTEKQISQSFYSLSGENHENGANVSNGSGSLVTHNFPPENSSDEEFPRFKDQRFEFGCLKTGHCKVFMESEDVGRNLDLTVIASYDELYKKLGAMFGLEKSDLSTNVVYSDEKGATKHTGDEPFSVFTKNARRLTILTDYGSVNLGN